MSELLQQYRDLSIEFVNGYSILSKEELASLYPQMMSIQEELSEKKKWIRWLE